MDKFGALIGGAVGAIVGALVWAGITYATHYEIGYVAWGIGLLVGGGVSLGSRGIGGQSNGMLALVLALAGIALGKAGVVYFDMNQAFDDREFAIDAVAQNVMAEREEAGRPVRFTPKLNASSMSEEYPPDVWREATSRFESMAADEQDHIRHYPPSAYDHWIVVMIADSIVEEHGDSGASYDWPTMKDPDADPWRQAHYPKDLWEDAEARWTAMSQEEQTKYYAATLDSHAAVMQSAISQFQSTHFVDVLKSSFSPIDLLWAFLAVGTAYRLGSTVKRVPQVAQERTFNAQR